MVSSTETAPGTELSPEPIDPGTFRQTLGAFVTGVTVITALDPSGVPVGVTVNSFSSLSLDPPLVLWNQSTASASHPAFRAAGRFAVNILSEDQVHLSERFARHKGDRFEGVSASLGMGGVPLLEGCSAHLECRMTQQLPGGDHMIFIGQVERLRKTGQRPLVFGGGSYLSAAPHEFAGASRMELTDSQMRAVRLGSAALPALAESLKACVALSVWGNHGPTIVRWEQPHPPLRAELRAGLVCRLTTTATGCVFSTWMESRTVQRAVLDELAAVAGETEGAAAARAAKFQTLRDSTRVAGHCTLASAVNPLSGSHEPLNAVAAPVFDAAGRLVAALTAVGFADQFEVGSLATGPTRLKEAAEKVSARLGFRQPQPA